VDPEYKKRLLANGTKACEELGLEIPALRLLVVENTPEVHNAIVCTLCSCYPRMLLGIPPEWYKSRNYRSRMVREPRAVLAEFGLQIPRHVTIRVHDSTARRHRRLERGAPRRARQPRQHDRRGRPQGMKKGSEEFSCNTLRCIRSARSVTGKFL
jgi:hypothetical protein